MGYGLESGSMRILENLLNLGAHEIAPPYQTNNIAELPIETKIVGDERWIRAISPSTRLSMYLVRAVPEPSPETITHLVEVNPEVDCEIYNSREPSKINFCPAGVWTRLSATVNVVSPATRHGYGIQCDDPAIVGKWIRVRRAISVAGDQEPDIWLPPESALTPEQIATLPPYGDYKEIQTF